MVLPTAANPGRRLCARSVAAAGGWARTLSPSTTGRSPGRSADWPNGRVASRLSTPGHAGVEADAALDLDRPCLAAQLRRSHEIVQKWMFWRLEYQLFGRVDGHRHPAAEQQASGASATSRSSAARRWRSGRSAPGWPAPCSGARVAWMVWLRMQTSNAPVGIVVQVGVGVALDHGKTLADAGGNPVLAQLHPAAVDALVPNQMIEQCAPSPQPMSSTRARIVHHLGDEPQVGSGSVRWGGHERPNPAGIDRVHGPSRRSGKSLRCTVHRRRGSPPAGRDGWHAAPHPDRGHRRHSP